MEKVQKFSKNRCMKRQDMLTVETCCARGGTQPLRQRRRPTNARSGITGAKAAREHLESMYLLQTMSAECVRVVMCAYAGIFALMRDVWLE